MSISGGFGMKRLPFLAVFAFLILSVGVPAQTVISIRIDGSINPAVSDFVHRAIDKAQTSHAVCLVIHLNTPGGLLKSTRVIVSDLLESEIPVVVYVSPGGAHAGSAGVFITMAAHIAAMAPGTNIGAAHPVSLEGKPDSIMNEKSTNDAAAFIRTIAEKRHRNLRWAEEAVRKSLSITETEALAKNVIDLVAKNDEELLQKIDGTEVTTVKGSSTLRISSPTVETFEMGWSEKILDILSDPNIAYIFFMLGVYGLLFELYNPGSILPGVIGVISLILAFYSMHTLPVNYAGLGLIIFSLILFIAEIKVVSHGILAIGGAVSLLLGSMMLIRSDSTLEFVELSKTLIITSVVLTTAFFLFVLGMGLKAQRRKPTTGAEGIVGEVGIAITDLEPHGQVQVHGETWNAKSVSGTIFKGKTIRVKHLENLTLHVQEQTTEV